MRKFLASLLILGFLTSLSLRASDFEDNLKDVISQGNKVYLVGYVKPFATAIGIGMGGALFHRGSAKTLPRFDVGISATYVMIPEEEKYFGVTLPGLGDVTAPTVFGPTKTSNPMLIPGTDENKFIVPVLHANIGLFANFEAMVRFATKDLGDFGRVTIYGGGLKYELSDLIPIPMFPIDFGVQAAYHKFTLGDYLTSGTFSMNFQASGSLPLIPFDVYGGVGYDVSSTTVKTMELVSGTNLGDVTIDGDTGLRLNAGVSFTLLFFNVHADYNIGKYNSLSGGVMIVF
jgi:hypothetical protein